MHYLGKGVSANPSQAAFWWRKSAEQGFPDAQLKLGVLYDKGRGVDKDQVQAMYWFRKAAEQGEMQAQNSLGMGYLNGEGVEKDPTQAAYWFRKAAEQGYGNAQFNLSIAYSKGRGVKKDLAQSAYWVRKAAEQGDADAQWNLANNLDRGRGVGRDPAQAMYWFRKVAEQRTEKSISARYLLAMHYLKGDGVPQDAKQAEYWIDQAAELRELGMLSSIAGNYISGELIPKNIRQGLLLLRRGAALDNPESIAMLGRLYAAGLGVEKDMRKAREYLERAAALWQTDGDYCPKKNDKYDQGCATALRHLALMWKDGLGGPKESWKAHGLYSFIEGVSPGTSLDETDDSNAEILGSAFRIKWASATLPQSAEQACLPSAQSHETITFKAKPGIKPSRYFDAAIYMHDGVLFGTTDLEAWQHASDILQQCGIQLRQLRVYSEEDCQRNAFASSIASAVPVDYKDIVAFPSASRRKLTIKITNTDGSRNGQTIAHEFGHLFGSFSHPADFVPNIMQYAELTTDTFSPAQCEAMRLSPLLARLPSLPTKRSDTSSSMPAAWKGLSIEERIKQIQSRNSAVALFYEFRPNLDDRGMDLDEFIFGKSKFFSNLKVAMLARKYALSPSQVLRMVEVAHDWPTEAGWPTEKTVIDLSGKPDLFWLPDWQKVSTEGEVEKRRVVYRSKALNKCAALQNSIDQSIIDSDKTWCNVNSLDLESKRNLRPGDVFTIDPKLSSRIGFLGRRDMEVWLHGGNLFYVVLSPRGREVVVVTANALGLWDGESLDDVRKNTWYDRDWENPKLNPVEEIHSDVLPTSTLRTGNFGAPTPSTLPGAKTVTPREVWQTIVAGYGSSKRAQKALILAAMDDTPCLPTAHDMAFAAKGGSYDDEVQKKLQSKMLELGAKKDQPVVVYCHHKSCWLSYNLGLRLVALGYTNVQWMRGGWEDWHESGLPMWTIETVQTP